jgi:hypothetical protein
MSSEEPRIARVTVTTGSEERSFRFDADAGTPQKVTVEFDGGKTVEVNADGGFTIGTADGRKITVNADGEVQAISQRGSGRVGNVTISGSRGVQIGPGGFQANVF